MTMAEALRLRTMARKSVFYGGRYDGLSVQQMLDMKKYGTLRWYYFHCSMISYLPDILDELHITERYRIDKPGTDPSMYEELQEAQEKRFKSKLATISTDDPARACAIYKHRKRREVARARDRVRQEMNSDRVFYSKANMQRRNHGH